MNEIRAGSWHELHDALFADSWDGALARHRSPCALRGGSDASFAPDTSLMRSGGLSSWLKRHHSPR